MVPDLASLAGAPGYLFFTPDDPPPPDWAWQGVGGDSMTGPLHAAAFARVRSALAHAGVEPPALLAPVLYELASDPVTYAAVFQDVRQGNNKVFNDDCCEAEQGYDLTTALGQLDFAALTDALVARAQVSVPAPPAPPVTAIPAFTG